MDDYTKKISVFEKVTSDNNAIRLEQIQLTFDLQHDQIIIFPQ